MRNTRYHPGGFQPDAPAQNRAEEWDSVAAMYTSWDSSGSQTSQRPLTDKEITGFAEASALNVKAGNEQTLRTKAQQALAANDTFLAVGAAATAAQVRTQTITLTKECNALIRLLLNELDSTSGT